jgi:folate-binding protein YgfZ
MKRIFMGAPVACFAHKQQRTLGLALFSSHLTGMATHLSPLPTRAVLEITGAERAAFLNGLVSNDVSRATPLWAAMLTAQGRYFADFFVIPTSESLLLDVPETLATVILAKLQRHKLRAAVAFADVSADWHVYASWGGAPPDAERVAPDPRLPAAGHRILSRAALPAGSDPDSYAAHRIALGLPDGPPDLEVDKTLLLEAGFDELGGIDWQKGCYMGQELTARTKYRGLVKRRLIPVSLSDTGVTGTPVLAQGQEVGSLRSVAGGLALAMLRLDALNKPLLAGNALLTPQLPPWLRLPASTQD